MPDPTTGGVVVGAATWLLTYLLHSSVVVGAVWLLVWTGWVRRPTTQDLLWKVALTAALATASVDVLSPARITTRRLDVEVRGTALRSDVMWQGGPPRRSGLLVGGAKAADPSLACREALDRLRGNPALDARVVRRSCMPPARTGWRGWLVALWLLIGAGLLLRMFRLRRDLWRSIRDAVPADPDLQSVTRGLLGPSHASARVVVAGGVRSPCVAAGRIVLPARCVAGLTPDELRAVLAHEVAHLVRRDPAWIGLGEVLCRALWLQPLNRVALAGLKGTAELVCDDWAVERTRRPLELANSIARVAQWLHSGRGTPAWGQVAQLAYLAPGEGHTLSTRVRRILTPGTSRRAAPRLLRLLLAALVVAPTLAVPAVPRGTAVMAVFVRRQVGPGGELPSAGRGGENVVILVSDAPRPRS